MPRKRTRRKVISFPLELWLVIFSFAIDEDIIRLDGCDHTTFPYFPPLWYSGQPRYRVCATYSRLCLVCRTFNLLLSSSPPYEFTNNDLSTMPNTAKALRVFLPSSSPSNSLTGLLNPSNCQQLVHLDVLHHSRAPGGLGINDILCIGDGQAFCNLQRLTFRIADRLWEANSVAFWAPLQRASPRLVTLVITSVERSYHGSAPMGESDAEVTFDRLEILYLDIGIPASGFHLPRLRQASVWALSPSGFQTFKHSPQLESLLIRGSCNAEAIFDLRSLSRLKLLGLPGSWWRFGVAPFHGEHPLEHLWLIGTDVAVYGTLLRSLENFPGISRLTVDCSLELWTMKELRKPKFKADLASLGLSIKSPRYDGDRIVEMGYAAIMRVKLKGGFSKQAWSKVKR